MHCWTPERSDGNEQAASSRHQCAGKRCSVQVRVAPSLELLAVAEAMLSKAPVPPS